MKRLILCLCLSFGVRAQSYPAVRFVAIQVFTPEGIRIVQLDASILLDLSGPFPVLKAAVPTARRTEVFRPIVAISTLSVALMPDGKREFRIYRNGLLLALGIDYAVSGKAVRFLLPIAYPQPGDIVQVSYGPV